MRFDPRARPSAAETSYAARTSGRTDLEVCCGFLEHVRGRACTVPERQLLNQAFEAVILADVEAYAAVADAAAVLVEARDQTAAG